MACRVMRWTNLPRRRSSARTAGVSTCRGRDFDCHLAPGNLRERAQVEWEFDANHNQTTGSYILFRRPLLETGNEEMPVEGEGIGEVDLLVGILGQPIGGRPPIFRAAGNPPDQAAV